MPRGATRVRLDVAGFVGFAERGPLDVPVAVEDINQYRRVFGGDVILATDRGIPVYANLPGAVQALFDNGGRRCYMVRVAGPQARPTRWRVPGGGWEPGRARSHSGLVAGATAGRSGPARPGTRATRPLRHRRPGRPSGFDGKDPCRGCVPDRPRLATR